MSSVKPWEEEWLAEEKGRYLQVKGGPCLAEINTGPNEPERFRLAAAAPDLVRALREIEWSGKDDRYVRPYCPACGGNEPDDRYPRGTGGHEEHCVVYCALKKAGVYDD